MSLESWQQFSELWFHDVGLGFSMDLSRVPDLTQHRQDTAALMERALAAMVELEAGAVANPDEGRQVGHYWLRAPERAPDPAVGEAISGTVDRVKSFAADILAGRIAPAAGARYRHVLHIGIGGSALGPQLADAALPGDGCRLHFLDNTDPDGIARVLEGPDLDLATTLTVVVSKSGGTRETRNGMQAAAAACMRVGVPFAAQAVAITGPDSALDRQARAEDWLLRLPMPDWIGGRTSQTSVVGLLPLALSGGDVDGFLAGARDMDELTRRPAARNPAALLAVAWHRLTGGHAGRTMVVLPYKDRLSLLTRYLQQLVMESLGKEQDLDGRPVHQGLTVYGNKGTTDQHAFVQQLREGPDDFFVTFVQVLEDGGDKALQTAPATTAGDELLGFLLGTRAALMEKGRPSLMLTLERLDASSLGALIALFERTVGLYATMVHINAYHQPGVEAGKRAAGVALELQALALGVLSASPGQWMDAAEVASAGGRPEACETFFHMLRHMAFNAECGVEASAGQTPASWRFRICS